VNTHFGSRQILKGFLLAMIVLAVGTAMAASKGSLELRHPTGVAGKQLPTGNYTVRWDGTGDQVELKIYQGKNVVLSTPARVVKMEHKPARDSMVVQSNPDGTSNLSQIRFGGKDYALEIASPSNAGAEGASASQ
jgi:hypothetical protein